MNSYTTTTITMPVYGIGSDMTVCTVKVPFPVATLVTVTVSKPYTKKSHPQRKYEHGVLYTMIAEWSGNSLEDVKLFCKTLFLSDKATPIPRIRSTEDLSTVEAEEYYEQVRRHFAVEYGLSIPTPNEVVWIDEHNFTFNTTK